MEYSPKIFFAFFFIGVMLSVACSKESGDGASFPIKRVAIDSLYTFVSFEKQDIADPSDIKILRDNSIAVTDFSTQKIMILDRLGNVQTSFGRQGRGPGEFLNIRDIYETEKGIAVYDSHQNSVSFYNLQGEFLETHTLPSNTMGKDFTIINDSLYVFGKEGLDGNLLQIQSLTSDYAFGFGKPIVEWEKNVDLSKSATQMKSGEVPDIFKNRVYIRSDGEFIFAFFIALSEMQKYDLKGDLIWHKKINLPLNKEIFEGTVERAKKYSKPNSLPLLSFIKSFQIIENDIFILTDRPKNGPQFLVHLNSEASIKTIYSFPKSHVVCYDVDYEVNTGLAYFTNCLSGVSSITKLP